MPLYIVLRVLMCLDGVLLVVTATSGITLGGPESILRHYALGMLTAFFTCFLHVLVLFYFIGTGKDIREAVEVDPELQRKFVPWTRVQKRRVFPAATFATVLTILATLLGGEVHSRILAIDGGATLPLRTVSAWWVHLVLVLAALLANGYAFVVEVATVRENRLGIEEINRRLSRRDE